MRNWQLTGLVVGAAALLFTARPAQAQVWVSPPVVVPAPPVWIGPPAPVVVGRPSVVYTRPSVVVASPPVMVARPPVVFASPPVAAPVGWAVTPGQVRRANRAARRAGW